MSTNRRPLLEPGSELAWRRINAEEAKQDRLASAAMSPVERLALGQHLSQQAVSLLVASVRAGHAPRRALWS